MFDTEIESFKTSIDLRAYGITPSDQSTFWIGCAILEELVHALFEWRYSLKRSDAVPQTSTHPEFLTNHRQSGTYPHFPSLMARGH